ncbi:MAG: hypothetical protein ABI675_11960 [Chitinophagaceae bacterium]
MQDYTIVLRNEKTNKYNTIAWLFILFNIAASIWIAIAKKDTGTTGFPYILLPTFLVLFLHYRHLKSGSKKNSFNFSFLLLAFPWIFLKLFWVAAIVFLVSILHGIAIRTLAVHTDSDKIIYPSFPKRTIQWNELNNIILKDGLLTIDFKNNTIIQQLIEKTEHPVNEKEFNDFCSKQLQPESSTI